MKTSFRLFAVVFVLIAVNFVRAGDFVSQVLQPSDSAITITVPGDRFLVIRNFTQEAVASDGTPAMKRGNVSVTAPFTATVVTATIASTDPNVLLEPVNDVVVGGPATVTVTPGDTTCFITYRKGVD